MQVQAIVTVVYATLLEFGGVMGFIKARSKPSLIAGVVSGGIGYASAALMFAGFEAGRYVATVLAALLLIMFAVKLGKASAGTDSTPAEGDAEAQAAAARKASSAKIRALFIAILSAVELAVLWAL